MPQEVQITPPSREREVRSSAVTLPQAITQMGRVSGQVVEDGTNTPVADARVFVVLDGSFVTPVDAPTGSVTDQDGRYLFDALPPGRYRIAAQKAGFAPPMEPSAMQAFEVAPGQELANLIVSLQRGGAITGRVLDSSGRPFAQVGVTALLKRLNSNDGPAEGISSDMPMHERERSQNRRVPIAVARPVCRIDAQERREPLRYRWDAGR
jgi:hypothetical protein